MRDLVTAGDIFIWLTSIVAGALLLLAAYRALLAKSLSPQSKALLGNWFGYGHFHSRSGDLFYKERITVSRNYLLPWRLRVEAEPATETVETVYRGRLRCEPPFIFCTTYEPTFGDRAYEIGRRIMDSDHGGKMIVGLCLGNTYDDTVHCATVHIWTRKELDPSANRNRPADVNVERAEFMKIAADYFAVAPDTYQLKLL